MRWGLCLKAGLRECVCAVARIPIPEFQIHRGAGLQGPQPWELPICKSCRVSLGHFFNLLQCIGTYYSISIVHDCTFKARPTVLVPEYGEGDDGERGGTSPPWAVAAHFMFYYIHKLDMYVLMRNTPTPLLIPDFVFL